LKLLKNLTISKKLLVFILLSIIALCTIGFTGLFYIKSMAQNTKEMYEKSLVLITNMMQIRVNNRASDAYTLELLLTTDQAKNNELNEQLTSVWEEMDNLLYEIEKGNLTEEEQELVSDYKTEAQELDIARKNVVDLALENKNEEAYALFKEDVDERRKTANNNLKELQSIKTASAEKKYKANQNRLQTVTTIVFSIIAVSLILLLLISYFIGRMITRPVKEIKNLLMKAEAGDFTVKGAYQSKDEIGELTSSFNHMTEKLQSVFSTVQDSSQQVASASEELSASSEQNSRASEHISLTIQELATGSDAQVAKVKESNKVITTITEHTKLIASHTEKMSENVKHASDRGSVRKMRIYNVRELHI